MDIKNLNLWSWQSTSKKIDYNGQRCESKIVVNGFRVHSVVRNGVQTEWSASKRRVYIITVCIEYWSHSVHYEVEQMCATPNRRVQLCKCINFDLWFGSWFIFHMSVDTWQHKLATDWDKLSPRSGKAWMSSVRTLLILGNDDKHWNPRASGKFWNKVDSVTIFICFEWKGKSAVGL